MNQERYYIVMPKPELDMDGLLKAFSDAKREKFEYLLDTYTGVVHFVPLDYLRLADEGKLEPEALSGQQAERARIALDYADDIEGRLELVPFVDLPEAEADWRAEFLREQGLSEIAPESLLDWNRYKAERLQEEVVAWVEDLGILDDDTEW